MPALTAKKTREEFRFKWHSRRRGEGEKDTEKERERDIERHREVDRKVMQRDRQNIRK